MQVLEQTTTHGPAWMMILQSAYQTKKARNPSYSLRAFSRDLGVSSSVLSRVLNGKRVLTAEQACKIGFGLKLNADEFVNLISSVIQ